MPIKYLSERFSVLFQISRRESVSRSCVYEICVRISSRWGYFVSISRKRKGSRNNLFPRNWAHVESELDFKDTFQLSLEQQGKLARREKFTAEQEREKSFKGLDGSANPRQPTQKLNLRHKVVTLYASSCSQPPLTRLYKRRKFEIDVQVICESLLEVAERMDRLREIATAKRRLNEWTSKFASAFEWKALSFEAKFDHRD